MTHPVQYDFSGKVVVITGGSRGIGHAMALGFAAAGARLAIASRKLDTCEATVKEIRSLGAQGSAHAVHVGKWSSWSMLVIMTFTIVANLKHIKERIHVPR